MVWDGMGWFGMVGGLAGSQALALPIFP